MLTIVNFRVKSQGRNAQELAAIQAHIVDQVTRDGQLWISDTVVNGGSVLRVMVISYLTEERHLRSLERALEAAVRSTTSRVG
jgi:cell division ATPase FtsA